MVGLNMIEGCLYNLVRINGQLNLEGVQHKREAVEAARIIQLPPLHPSPFRRPLPYYRQITSPRHSDLIHTNPPY